MKVANIGEPEGNELNKMTTWFNVGVIVGAPFSNLILTVLRPRIWLPTCLSSWSVIFAELD